MKFALLLTLAAVLSTAADSFITKYEYGAYLYKNPRGIGCHKCHGDNAQGKLIAAYTEEKNQKQLRGPGIVGIDKKSLIEALQQAPSAMPTYNLTVAEIDALHLFLKTPTKD